MHIRPLCRHSLAAILCLVAVAAWADTGTVTAADGAPGLRYAYYETDLGSVLDLAGLTATSEGTVADFTLPEGIRTETYGVEWYGALEVPTDGDYTFYTESDDGSLLAIGAEVVVWNDYDHGATEVSGKVHLAAGQHPVWVGFFQGMGDQAMSVKWEGPGIEKSPIPAAALTLAPRAYTPPTGGVKTTTLAWPEIGQGFDVRVDTRAAPALAFMQDVIPEVIAKNFPKMWEKLGTDRTHMPATVRFTMRHNIDYPAYASGGGVTFSAEWFTERPGDLGCIVHELSHIVQSYDKQPEGTGWISEGLADYVRYYCAVDTNGWGIQVPYRPGMKYTEGYGTAAGFFYFVEKTYDPKIAVKLGHSLKYGDYTPDLWKDATGKTLDELWEEYKTAPAPVPARPDAQ
jgi:hypothetical protein